MQYRSLILTAVTIFASSAANLTYADVLCERKGNVKIFRGLSVCKKGYAPVDFSLVSNRGANIIGPQGFKGEVGAQGATGPQGLKGEKGDRGEQGPQGMQGMMGLQGIRGDKGEKGDTGAQGVAGPQGVRGVTGAQGVKGDMGAQGIHGLKGDKGDTGTQGLQGVQGIQGPKGDKGDTGAAGAQGPKGERGDIGPQGPEGDSVAFYSEVLRTCVTQHSIFTIGDSAGDPNKKYFNLFRVSCANNDPGAMMLNRFILQHSQYLRMSGEGRVETDLFVKPHSDDEVASAIDFRVHATGYNELEVALVCCKSDPRFP